MTVAILYCFSLELLDRLISNAINYFTHWRFYCRACLCDSHVQYICNCHSVSLRPFILINPPFRRPTSTTKDDYDRRTLPKNTASSGNALRSTNPAKNTDRYMDGHPCKKQQMDKLLKRSASSPKENITPCLTVEIWGATS